MVINALHSFFGQYEDVGKNAIKAREDIYVLTRSKNTTCKEIDIDVLLPFLLPIEEACQFYLAYLLGACRDVIDYHNHGKQAEHKLLQFIQSNDPEIKFRSLDEYLYINVRCRSFEYDDLGRSYLRSTERVYYRMEALSRNLKGRYALSKQVMNSIEALSAFLLFDDDVCDIENDIAYEKTTILTEYLLQSGDISSAIHLMAGELSQHKIAIFGYEKYNAFLEGIIDVYLS